MISILIVDDEPDMLFILDTYIRDECKVLGEMEIDTCSNARDAIKKVIDKKYDIVISDHGLADTHFNGCCVLRYAKDSNAFTVIFSGSFSKDSKKESFVDAILPKPWDIEDWPDLLQKFQTFRNNRSA